MDDISWRPPTRADDAALLGLIAEIEATDRRGQQLVQEELDDEWASVWAHPETDSVYAWAGEELVAFGWLKTEVGSHEHHKIWCWGGVSPSRRGRGVGRALLTRQVARAEEVGATLDPSLPVELQIEAGADQHDLARLAAEAGFAQGRRFLEVVRAARDPVARIADPVPGLELVGWSPELDRATRDAYAEAFADHWGSEPRTAESWRQWHTGHRAFRSDLSRLVLERTTGEVVAFVLAAAYPTDWDSGPREAWIQDVGTRRAWRGRGVARWALSEVLRSVAAAADGFDRSILGVDAANPTGALALYRSLGFRDERVSVRFVREL